MKEQLSELTINNNMFIGRFNKRSKFHVVINSLKGDLFLFCNQNRRYDDMLTFESKKEPTCKCCNKFLKTYFFKNSSMYRQC
jgi:hypothetical protein